MSSHLIRDTGPWVDLHRRDDAHHAWAKAQFAQHAGPFLTCEAVVAETYSLLAHSGFDPGKALALIERGVVQMAMSLADEMPAVRALFGRHENGLASLAEVCLVRMSELHEPCRVITFDSNFHIYRRHGRKMIPVLTPRPRDPSA